DPDLSFQQSAHPEQSKSVHDTYPIKQNAQIVNIDSLDMNYDREEIDQNDDDNDLAKERELLASLIKKLKCEIDDSKNRNKLESSNNFFKEANNRLSETNNLLYADYKKSEAELTRRNSKEYVSQMELECAKVRGDLLSYKMEYQKSCTKYTEMINDLNQTISEMNDKLYAHQETISILSQQKDAQITLYKTREDKELDKVIELENKVKVLDNIVYKTGQSVQTMNMLNNKYRTSFAKPKFLKKAQRANPRLYGIGMYKLHTDHNQARTSQLPQDSGKTNKRVSFSTGVISTTSVSRPQLKSNQMGDRVMRNNSQGKKQEVEDQREARIWLDKEPPRSILMWEDLVLKFINQFFPPSKTTYLWNEITNFLQKPNETFNEAWEHFKDFLRQCPHHGFSELHQLNTFYYAVNPNDQDALDSAVGGNFLDKIPRECLSIIKSKSKVRYSRSRVTDSRANTNAPYSFSLPSNSFDLQQIAASLEDKLDIRMNRFEKSLNDMKASFVNPTAPIKAVEEVCVTCGGNRSYNHCPLTRGNEFLVFHDNILQFQTAAVGILFKETVIRMCQIKCVHQDLINPISKISKTTKIVIKETTSIPIKTKTIKGLFTKTHHNGI
nr:reverse transcriptase domain-containing protein [Tanacetum cinerariifolium]